MIASTCILCADGVWQVRNIDVEEKGCQQDGSVWDAVLEASFVFYIYGKIETCNF